MNARHDSTPVWRKSSYSGANGQCVEVALPGAAAVAVRDSKDPLGPSLSFSADAWAAFVTAAGSGGLGGV
jgi:hypothetical protein